MRYHAQAYVWSIVLLYSLGLCSIESITLRSYADPKLDQYQRFLQEKAQTLSGFHVQSIEFPVQKNQESTQKFMRKGFLVIRPNAIGTVIICHGYTHSKHEAFFFQILFSHFNVLAFDFRGHGELVDKGQYSTIGRDEVFDVLGAVSFVKSHPDLKNIPIFGFGFSMGAVSLLQAQAQDPSAFELLILDSPFDSSDDCMQRGIEKLLTVSLFGKQRQLPGKSLIMKMLYSDTMRPVVKRFFQWASGMNPYKIPTKFVPVLPIKHANEIKVPCMFISCSQDRSVSVDCVKRLYDAVNGPFKRLWITQGIKHCGSCMSQPELYAYNVNKFIKDVFDKNFAEPSKIIDEGVILQVTAS